MYQSTYDIAQAQLTPINFIYRQAMMNTDWCLLMDDLSQFNFPGGLVDVPEIEQFGNFRYSGYRCPMCSKDLYKTVFPEGTSIQLVFNDETGDAVEPARVFTCPDCLNYFASQKGTHITDAGGVVMAHFDKNPEGLNLYNMWFEIFNTLGDPNARRNE